MRSFIDAHPQYADLVDRARPGLLSDAEASAASRATAAIDDEPTPFEEEL